MEQLRESVLPNGKVLITAEGELDAAEVERVRGVIAQAFGKSQDVVVDLEGIAYLDSSILAALISESLDADKNGRCLTLVTGANGLLRSFELKGLMQVMHIARTLGDV